MKLKRPWKETIAAIPAETRQQVKDHFDNLDKIHQTVMKDKFKDIIENNVEFADWADPHEVDAIASECATLCDQFAVEFAEWKDLNSYPVTHGEQKGFYMYDNSKHPGMLNLIDLYEIFKKQRDEK